MNPWIAFILGILLGGAVIYFIVVAGQMMPCEFNELDTDTDRRGPTEDARLLDYLEQNEGMLMFNEGAAAHGWGYVKNDHVFWAAARTVRDVLRRAIQREVDDAHMSEVSE